MARLIWLARCHIARHSRGAGDDPSLLAMLRAAWPEHTVDWIIYYAERARS